MRTGDWFDCPDIQEAEIGCAAVISSSSLYPSLLYPKMAAQEDDQMQSSPAAPAPSAETNKLYVGNLSWSLDAESLRVEFAQHGEVVDCHVPTDRETGRSRGFAFVTFADVDGARAAQAALNGAELGGRAVRIDFAQPKPEGAGFGGGRGPFTVVFLLLLALTRALNVIVCLIVQRVHRGPRWLWWCSRWRLWWRFWRWLWW